MIYKFMEKLTLEKHLEILCNEEKDYEILHSIWSLNKTNLSKGLKLIPSIYPNYSVHDETHSNKIIDSIELLLGEERIEKLSPTDTFLILMACYTHDIGMILTYKVIEKKWQDNKMKSTINSFTQSQDKVIADAANLILSFQKADQKNSKKTDKDNLQWALKVKNAVTILTAELFRSDHAQMSSTYMTENEEFLKLADGYYWNQLPGRFKDLLANIAMLHGKDFSLIFKILKKEANGFKGDYIHPRFVACLLRLGDLLDFDDGRFNTFSIATIKNMPKMSELHYEKHASVKHILISPKAIEAELDCKSDKVYRISRNWFDMLEDEVNKQSREWISIAPDNLGGLPPVISKDSIKILYQGVQTKPELMNLRFTISNKKIFEMLAGGGIYDQPGFVFIREIVQNALDASKIQLWKDIENGIYGSYLKEIKDIKFPEDIDRKIYDLYPIKLEVKWKDEKRDALIVTCEDKGTGISEDSLIRMTSQVGESHKKDSSYEELISRIPFWLKPTAAFGIGMQSIFFVNNEFNVNTQYPGESAKHIIFRSAADNSYISIASDHIKMRRGTKISVEIPKNRFKELFGTSVNINLLNTFDPLENPDDDLWLAKINDFINDTFQYNRLIPIKYKLHKEEIKFGITKNDSQKENNPIETIERGEDYQITKRTDNAVVYYSIAEAIYGSVINISFYKPNEKIGFDRNLLLRNIPIKQSNLDYYELTYMNLTWNLCNPDSDKVVNLSRDKLIYKGYNEIHQKLIIDLLPKFLPILEKDLAKSISEGGNNETTKKLKEQYFNLCLSLYALAGNEYSKINKNLLDDTIIVRDDATCNNGDTINAKTFFESEQFIICAIDHKIAFLNGRNATREFDKSKSLELENIHQYNNQDNIIWQLSFLEAALRNHFRCTNIYIFENDTLIYLIKKITIEEEANSSLNDVDYENEEKLPSYIYNTFSKVRLQSNRPSIYGIKKYKNIIIKPFYVTGFEDYPPFSNSIIFSPFFSQEEMLKWCKDVDLKNQDEQKAFIYNYLKEHLADHPLIEVIKKYNIKDTEISDEDIYNSYTELLLDFYKGYQEKQKEKCSPSATLNKK